MPDYARTARLLRQKAADPVVPDTERQALLDKAAELEAKYGTDSSPFTYDTTVTSRDGRTSTTDWLQDLFRTAEAKRQAEDLLKNQWQWNSEYYDRYGNPKTSTDDIFEEDFKYAPEDGNYENEDYGYEEY